ncbi:MULTISPECIES: Crp/Fnr family transcriptional regulator [unclassified Roseovarius]|uniref:Crp/Fnr family transcriptional regulator n=1 Tax=unclassified Roseovarius TaxID=2614913 RepID=UPI00273F063D|nr:Crp/Fnr family transcriptional regulator [Roseovarius sp. MMSF_3350]
MVYGTNNGVLCALGPKTHYAVTGQCEDVTLKAGAVLQRSGEATHAVYFPETAVVSAIATYSDGSGIEMANMGREASTAVNLLLGQSHQLHTDEVQIGGAALRLPAERFLKLKSDHAEFERVLLASAQSVFYQVMISGACNGTHDARQRLARWLLTMADRIDGAEMRLTHDFLSEMLGVRRATVTKAAQDLQENGLISYTRGRIRITNRKGLREASCECYDLVRNANRALLPNAGRNG